jgi:F-type H+-transporting ATPase subunit epsilon
MNQRLTLRLVTPYRQLASLEVDEVVLPGELGELGILPGHAPLLSTLGIGDLRYRTGSEEQHFAVAGGMVEIEKDEVTVLAETGEMAAEIDRAKVRAAVDQVESELRKPNLSEEEFNRLRLALLHELTRLKVSEWGRR